MVGLQLAKMVTNCEAGLPQLVFMPNTFLYWVSWWLLACRWLCFSFGISNADEQLVKKVGRGRGEQ